MAPVLTSIDMPNDVAAQETNRVIFYFTLAQNCFIGMLLFSRRRATTSVFDGCVRCSKQIVFECVAFAEISARHA